MAIKGLGNAIVGGLFGLAQGAIDVRTAKRNTEATIDANRKMAEYQYSKDLEMWNRANEYNTPAKQMERYTSAGLNPNLIYGTGSASAGNTATSLPKYQSPTAQFDYKPAVQLPMILSMFQDFNIKQAQTDNLREQNRILTSTADMKALDSMAYGYIPKEHEKNLSSVPMVKRELQKTQLMRSQADALRVQTDNAIKQIQLAWMKKLGVSGLGGIMNAISSGIRILR